jgi:hypothetical protein
MQAAKQLCNSTTRYLISELFRLGIASYIKWSHVAYGSRTVPGYISQRNEVTVPRQEPLCTEGCGNVFEMLSKNPAFLCWMFWSVPKRRSNFNHGTFFPFLASFTGDFEGSPTFKPSKVLRTKHVKGKITFPQIRTWRKRYSISQPWCVEPKVILYVQWR